MNHKHKLTIALLASVGALAASTGSASAGLVAGPLEYELVEGVLSPGHEGTITAGCLQPKRLIGGGGSITVPPEAGPEVETALASSAPYDGADLDPYADDGFRAGTYNASADGRTSKVWAVCLEDAATLSYAKNATTTSSSEHSQAVACADATQLVGGGAYVEGPHAAGSWLISASAFEDPDPNELPDDGWGYTAARPGGGSAAIAAHAICLPKGEREIRYRQRFVKAGGGAAKVGGGVSGGARLACPKGFHASGGGVYGDLRIRASVPFDGDDQDSAPDDGWRVKFYSPGGPDEVILVQAICLR